MLCSCSHAAKDAPASIGVPSSKETPIAEKATVWDNKTIIFPEELSFEVKGQKVDYGISNCDYKIVTFTDTSNCTQCSMKLDEWQDVFSEIVSTTNKFVKLCMVISPKDIKLAKRVIMRSNVKYPICFDNRRLLDSLNNFLPDADYQTFLLDSCNNILAIGNPVLDPKVKEKYMSIVRDSVSASPNNHSIYISNKVKYIGAITRPTDTKYIINNNGDRLLLVSGLVTSSPYLKASVNHDSIPPHSDVTLTLTVLPDMPAGEFDYHTDIYTKGDKIPHRLTVCGFK